jgi:hypothetical protein
MGYMKADPASLRAKANKINGGWPTVPESPFPPDELELASQAVRQIVANRDYLDSCIKAGQSEAARLAACMEAAATAYEQVDEMKRKEIESGQPAGPDAVTPNPNLPPQVPVGIGECCAPPTNPYAEWPTAALQLAASNIHVLDFAEQMYAFSDALTARAKDFSPGDTHWEGQAAEAAEAAMRQHESWLYDVAAKSREIAKQALDFYNAHEKAKADHPEPFAGGMIDMDEFSAKQTLSEVVRGVYSTEATFPTVDIPKPPSGAYAPAPVSKNDVPTQPGPAKQNGGQPGQGAGGGGGGGGGEQQPAGAPTDSVSPASATTGQQGGAGEQQGGSPAGGSPSGGSPSSGSGAGGSPGGGMPSGLPDGLADMPTQPTLRPAAADLAGGGGGPGSGAGGGGGGGGVPNSPLQPAAGAHSVASSPSGAAAGTVPVGAAGAAGGAGMGGMPMGGHGMGGQGQQGKERRRTPGLSPDEELYIEDREHTEGIIGRRPRRKDQQESK